MLSVTGLIVPVGAIKRSHDVRGDAFYPYCDQEGEVMDLPAQSKERLEKQLLRTSRTSLSLLVVGQDCYGRIISVINVAVQVGWR